MDLIRLFIDKLAVAFFLGHPLDKTALKIVVSISCLSRVFLSYFYFVANDVIRIITCVW